MFERENFIGILLLIFCAVVGVIMVNAIITGDTPSVPPALRLPFTIGGFALMGIYMWRRFSHRFKRR